MERRSRAFSALLVCIALVTMVFGVGTITAATGQSTGDGPAGHTMTAAAVPSGDDPDGDGYIPVVPPVTGVTPSGREPAPRRFHEFQANCAVSHTAPDDPVTYPAQPGSSRDHTFLGNTSTDAHSTTASLYGGATTCRTPGDSSAYWMPSLYDGDEKILPAGPQALSYKAGVTDYTSVRPFPKGLRFVVGSPLQSAEDFRGHGGWVAGWECGDSSHNVDIPRTCPAGTQLTLRVRAPSCWDGRYLDTPDHQSHMAYPVVAPGTGAGVCPASHPVALPMLEFGMAWPVDGDMSRVRLAGGRGYSFHYAFFNAWHEPTLKALVEHCVVGGLQCDARGYDRARPREGAALGPDYRLP
ncbi:hypothetical protein SFUMM280S_04910 [Streptomyces fumanus]